MQLIRSRRRSLMLEIHPERGVCWFEHLCACPKKKSKRFFIPDGTGSISTKPTYGTSVVCEDLVAMSPGEVFGYLSEELTLAHEPGDSMRRRPKAQRRGASLVLTLHRAGTLSGEERRQALRDSVIAWYRQAAHIELPPEGGVFVINWIYPCPRSRSPTNVGVGAVAPVAPDFVSMSGSCSAMKH